MILVISPYLDKTYAGWAKQTRKMFESIYFDKFKIEFLTLVNEKILDFQSRNISCKYINLNNLSTFKNKLLFVYFVAGYIYRNRKTIKSIYLPNLYWSSLVFILLSLFFKINFIGRVCANEIKNLNRYSFFKIYLLRKISKIIVLNNSTLQILENFKICNAYFIPNSVDTFFFKYSNSYTNSKLLFIGEIHPRKGLDVLIDTFLYLQVSYPYIKLELIGPINDIKFYNNLLLKINNGQKNIFFLPPMNQDELVKKYHENDIFILPSYSEGMPNVLLEAMSCGLIVVGAEIPGIIENIIHNHNGFIFSHYKNNLYSILSNILERNCDIETIKFNARKFIKHERSNYLIYNQIRNLFN